MQPLGNVFPLNYPGIDLPKVASLSLSILMIAQRAFCLVPKVEYPCDPQIREFPPHSARLMFPGLQLTEDGSVACDYEDSPFLYPFQSCELSQALVELSIHHFGQEGIVYTPMAFKEKGFTLELPKEARFAELPQRVRVGINPQKMANYKRALDYFSATVLKNPHFFESSPELIIDVLKITHHHLIKGLADAEAELTTGEFRKGMLWIFPDKRESSFEGLVELLKQKGGTPSEIRLFQQALVEVEKFQNFEIAWDHFSPEVKQIFLKIGALAPPAKHIPELMRKFADSLVSAMMERGPSRELAANVHQDLVEIHPFNDGNGRLARIWKNGILMLAGDKSVVIPNDISYTEAVSKGIKDRTAFYTYLVNTLIPWNGAQNCTL